MKQLNSLKEVQKFIGVIDCYRYMWLRPTHMLATLTILMSVNRKFKHTRVEQDAFNKIKRIMERDTLLTYPNFNEAFKMNTDASAFQLGVVISQKGGPIAFYSIQVTDSQKRYTMTDS